ncbi:MAG: SEC-C metal-binding domain-containing protein [Phycisphaerae bacterium]
MADQFERHFDRKREESERYKKSLPGADEPPLPPPVEPIKTDKAQIGRNDPCPCGSGKKFKQCCAKKGKK